MLRSEPRLAPEARDDLDRLDRALAAVVARDDHHDTAPAGPSVDALDRELRALVADVRATRPTLDADARMRLDARVQEATAEPTSPSRRSLARRPRLGLALAVVVAIAIPTGAVLQARGGGDGPDDEASVVASPTGLTSDGSAADDATEVGPTAQALRPGDTTPSGPAASAREAAPPAVSSGPRTGGPSGAVAPVTPTVGQAPLDAARRVVRDVEQTVRVAPGDVARAADRVGTVVQAAGGYLASSAVRERGPRAGGTFRIVVPTGRLDETVAALSRIGRPVRLERSSSDVTDEAVSLDDQLGDLRADRSAARLALARTVDPAKRAARRRELDVLSSRIAGLQGQRDALRRRTATARIDLRLTTATGSEDAAVPVPDDGSWGIGDAWADAGRVLEVGGGVLLLGGVVLLPLAVLGAAGAGLRRRAAERRRSGVLDRA